MDLGLLILRIVVGLLFIGHGTQKLFGWFGGHGLEGTGAYFRSLGYRGGRNVAALAGLAEAGAGLLLVLGFLTPIAAAAIIGVMTNVILAVHVRKGPWIQNGGYEYPLVLATVAATLAFVGAGRYSIDAAMNADLAGLVWGLMALAIGTIAGVIMLGSRKPPAAAEVEQRRAA